MTSAPLRDMSAKCSLCEATVRRPWLRRGSVTWWKCPGCGLLFVHPQPDDETLDRLYETAYYDAPSNYSSRKLQTWSDRVEAIGRVCRPCRVLDVGCGRGEFLMAALDSGWDAWGLEVADSAVRQLPDSLRQRITIGRLEDSPFERESFEALTYFDVIEHVRDPVEFLTRGRLLLKPRGCLVITTPNAATVKARLKGRRWKYLEFERYLHLYHFTPHTMELALKKAGFEVASWITRSWTPLWVVSRKEGTA